MNLAESIGFPTQDIDGFTDEELMLFVSAGRHDALRILFDRYHRLVFSVALRIVRDPGEAEEVVQTVFLDIFRAAANFDKRKGIFRVWILQYAYHRAFHRKRHLVANHFYHWDELEAALEIGARRALFGEMPEVLQMAKEMLARLKPRQRKVVEMTYYQGLTAEEIAARLSASVHAVRHDLHRGLAALRTIYGANQ
jgi:RNA polymerase sigma-70 factor, ECF subfamily